MSNDRADALGSAVSTQTALDTPLPWRWHVREFDGCYDGSIYAMPREGHAYAVAVKPRYVTNSEFAINAGLIVRAVNSHDTLVALVTKLRGHLNDGLETEHELECPASKYERTLIAEIDAALSQATAKQERSS